jgi:hypothetical protein
LKNFGPTKRVEKHLGPKKNKQKRGKKGKGGGVSKQLPPLPKGEGANEIVWKIGRKEKEYGNNWAQGKKGGGWGGVGGCENI